MGDPISPAMAIVTCAKMEEKWIATIPQHVRGRFVAKRYMDDILIIYAVGDNWNHDDFLEKMIHSYDEPLELEEGKEGTFLETTYEVSATDIRYKLKNENERMTKIWRYQHFQSYSPFSQKRATLIACLRKVQRHASDRINLHSSALAKLREFRNLGYPKDVLTKACTHLAISSEDPTWLSIRGMTI